MFHPFISKVKEVMQDFVMYNHVLFICFWGYWTNREVKAENITYLDVDEGTAVELLCTGGAKGNLEYEEARDFRGIIWKLSRQLIPTDSDGRRIIFNDGYKIGSRLMITQTRFYDAGHYTCYYKKKNSSNYVLSQGYTLHVRHNRVTRIPENTAITLYCPYASLFDHQSNKEARWMHNNQSTKFRDSGNSNYTFERITIIANSTTAGEWVCYHNEFKMTQFRFTIGPPLTYADKEIGLDLIYKALPMSLAGLLVSCICYAIVTIGILDKYTKQPEFQPFKPTEDDYREIIRKHLSNDALQRLWNKYYKDTAETVQNGYEVVLQKDDEKFQPVPDKGKDDTTDQEKKKQHEKKKQQPPQKNKSNVESPMRKARWINEFKSEQLFVPTEVCETSSEKHQTYSNDYSPSIDTQETNLESLIFSSGDENSMLQIHNLYDKELQQGEIGFVDVFLEQDDKKEVTKSQQNELVWQRRITFHGQSSNLNNVGSEQYFMCDPEKGMKSDVTDSASESRLLIDDDDVDDERRD